MTTLKRGCGGTALNAISIWWSLSVLDPVRSSRHLFRTNRIFATVTAQTIASCLHQQNHMLRRRGLSETADSWILMCMFLYKVIRFPCGPILGQDASANIEYLLMFSNRFFLQMSPLRHLHHFSSKHTHVGRGSKIWVEEGENPFVCWPTIGAGWCGPNHNIKHRS